MHVLDTIHRGQSVYDGPGSTEPAEAALTARCTWRSVRGSGAIRLGGPYQYALVTVPSFPLR